MKKNGFTFIEMIMVIIIAGISLPPLMSLIYLINTQTTIILPMNRPNTLAVDMLEEIKSKRWDENWIGGPLEDASKTSPANLGLDTGEIDRIDYDDIDDYKVIQNAVPTDIYGTPLPQYSDYRVSVNVYYVPGLVPTKTSNPVDFISIDTTNPPETNTKRIDVIINKGSNEYKVSTTVCNY